MIFFIFCIYLSSIASCLFPSVLFWKPYLKSSSRLAGIILNTKTESIMSVSFYSLAIKGKPRLQNPFAKSRDLLKNDEIFTVMIVCEVRYTGSNSSDLYFNFCADCGNFCFMSQMEELCLSVSLRTCFIQNKYCSSIDL